MSVPVVTVQFLVAEHLFSSGIRILSEYRLPVILTLEDPTWR
jgi:hypothetical protein